MSLAARDVEYSYRQEPGTSTPFVLERANLTIRAGAVTGLLGPNGCGKTTVLGLLAGLRTPAIGEITLDGTPLSTLTRRQIARRIAMVPQETHPTFDYTAIEIVLMGRHPHLGAFQLEGPADHTAALDAMHATNTAHLVHRLFNTLSGGEKQRVVIASALAQAADVLLLDEPTASLDIGHQLGVAAVLRELNRTRGVTMVVATHDLNLAASLCDELILMRDGRVVAHGPTSDVLTDSAIAALYDVRADVTYHAGAGRLTVVPLARTP